MAGVPVGRRGLFAERRRAFLGIAGVAVALLLMLALDGIFAGATRQLTRYIDTSAADVFVSQSGVRTMHMSSSAVPLDAVQQIRSLPGVAWAEPILYQSGSLAAADARQIAYLVGYVPGAAGGPPTLASGTAPGPGEIVVDDRAGSAMGLRIGDRLTALGRPWRVSGFSAGLTNISNTVAFVRFDDFAAATGTEGVASYILVGARNTAGDVARAIEDATGLTAQTRARFSVEESSIVKDMSADLMKIMTAAAFLIGLAVVGLTLYAATLARLHEIGVMKALGARPRRLAGVILSQAAWTIGPAIVVAVGLAYALAAVVSRVSANVSVVIEPASILRATAGAALLGALGAVAPLVKVGRTDPATVFRRQM
jgi:putative ABC transport system permease protein